MLNTSNKIEILSTKARMGVRGGFIAGGPTTSEFPEGELGVEVQRVGFSSKKYLDDGGVEVGVEGYECRGDDYCNIVRVVGGIVPIGRYKITSRFNQTWKLRWIGK